MTLQPRHTNGTQHEPTYDELNAAMRQQQQAEAQHGHLPTWAELCAMYPNLRDVRQR